MNEEMESGGALTKAQKQKLINKIKPISKEEAKQDYMELDEADIDEIKPRSLLGSKFINYFTFLERLNTQGNKRISFFEFWVNKSEYEKKEYVKKFIRWKKDNTKGTISKEKLYYELFRLYFGAVSLFKPVVAMQIYSKFKPTSILDFTMGWGGRLVGACALEVQKYIGIDLNKNLKTPYKDMLNTLEQLGCTTEVKLMFKDALKVDYSQLEYDCVFTSPPYYNIEVYSGMERMSKEQWDEQFYKPLFSKTYLHLKKGGHYILNIPKEVYEDVCIKLFGKAHMKIPLLEADKRNLGYKEFIYVWKK